MEPREALKLYRRTNLLLFPKNDLWLGEPTLDPEARVVTLTLRGYDTEFHFEWPAVAVPQGPEKTWYPTDKEDAARLLKLGFTELFEKLRALTTHFR